MASTCRKRKQHEREPSPATNEALARAILALPRQPQTSCCRVAGCREPLTPGYHKKYRICLKHSTYDELDIDGKTCRWCQQCGSFHGLEAFDAKYRSCRRSLARHQERRKHRQALQASRGKQARQQPHGEQSSQPGGDELTTQLPTPLPVAQLLPEVLDQAGATPPRQVAKQQQRRQAGGVQPGAYAKQAATSTPQTVGQLSVEESSQAEHSSSSDHQCKRSRPSPPAAAPPAASTDPVQRSDGLQPVTPPGQPGCHAARSLPLDQPPLAWAPVGPPSYAAPLPPPPPPGLWPLLHQATAAPASVGWGQQAPDRGWLLVLGDQRLVPAQPSLLPQHVALPACEMQQPGGQAFWLVQHPQRDGSGGGGSCNGPSSTTFYPCLEPALAQGLLPMQFPASLESPASRPFSEAAAYSTNTPATHLLARSGSAAHALQTCGSGAASTIMAATQLSAYCGGSSGAPPHSPHQAAGSAGRPPAWLAASLPAGHILLPTPDGYTCSSSALSQAWGQLARQESEQAALLAAAATPCATTQPSLQPGPPPSPHTMMQPSQLPATGAALTPSLPPNRLPSLPLPLVPLAYHQAQLRQQPGWQCDWSDDALLATQPSRPHSPAVSWLNGF